MDNVCETERGMGDINKVRTKTGEYGERERERERERGVNGRLNFLNKILYFEMFITCLMFYDIRQRYLTDKSMSRHATQIHFTSGHRFPT